VCWANTIICGIIVVLAHSTPKTSVNFLRFAVAASRIEYTQSPNQDIHKLPSFSSKNWTPNWLASNGICSIIAKRTLHCLSSASSTIAGSKDWDNNSIPITLLTKSNLDIIFKRTSGISSFNNCKNNGNKFSIVDSFPNNGANPPILRANEPRTCCDESVTKFFKHGKTLLRIVSFVMKAQKPEIWVEAAVLTSGSLSLKKLMK